MSDRPEETPQPAPEGNAVAKLVDLKSQARNPLLRWLASTFEGFIERVTGVKALNDTYASGAGRFNKDNFLRLALEALQVAYAISEEDLQKIPAEGPLVTVANHPFGGLEGIILPDILTRRRRDVKILGNYLLQMIPELSDWIIPVDPFENKASISANARALKEAIDWVKQGGALVMFPAGEVSHFHLFRGRVADRRWSPHVGAIIRRANASVLPVYFPGSNSRLFQLLGVVHPALRTMLLPRELMNKRGTTVEVFAGKPVRWERLEGFESDESLVDSLRHTTYFLRHRLAEPKTHLRLFRPKEPAQQPVIDAVSPDVLRKEIEALPLDQELVSKKELSIYLARAEQIPHTMQEIGRLREITFRESQEGTGLAVDLDRFDDYYLHLFIWNKQTAEVAGAYRLGVASEILRDHGPDGLYTSTLFRFKQDIFETLKDAVEMGRSFIRPEYQRKHACLPMLWQGIGTFIVRNPQHKILFGPVSISQDYHPVSRSLIIQFLTQHNFDSKLSQFVKARNPYHIRRVKEADLPSLRPLLHDIEDVSLLVSEIEKDGKGIPILLRHYLKLNATLMSFNVDKAFSNVVDGLILVDLTRTDRKFLRRFMGEEAAETFLSHHAEPAGAGAEG